jgi:hypothetical protein
VIKEKRTATHAGGGKGSLAAGMSAADNNYVIAAILIHERYYTTCIEVLDE